MIDEIFISEESLRTYLSINGNRTVTKDLLHKKYLNNIAELLGFASTIESIRPKVGRLSGFQTFFEQLKLLPARASLQVLNSPAAYHWNSVTRDLLTAVVSGKTSITLDRYLNHTGRGTDDGLISHLNDFGRFSLSGHIFANVKFATDIPLEVKLPMTLPGTKLVLSSYSGKSKREILPLFSIDPSQVQLLHDFSQFDSSDVLSFKCNDRESVLVAKLPNRKGEHGDVVIDAYDPCLNLPYVENYPRIRNHEITESFIVLMNKAFSYLAGYNSAAAAEIEMVTSSITLMDTSAIDAEMCSGTSSAIFGAYFLSATERPVYLAEMLLHEFSHNKLRLLEESQPFLQHGTSKETKFYSPWRNDSRPLDGIQHGLYVFSTIAYFWLHIWLKGHASTEERMEAQRRVATLLFQLKYAEKEFCENAQLTRTGRVFADEINKRIRFLEDAINGWDLAGLLPFFSGVVADRGLQEIPVVEALRKHRLNWEITYRQGELEIS